MARHQNVKTPQQDQHETEQRTTEQQTKEQQTNEEQTKEQQTREEQTKEQQTREEQTKEQQTHEEQTKDRQANDQENKEQETNNQQAKASRTPEQRLAEWRSLLADKSLEKQLLALSKEVEQRLAATPIRMLPWTKEEWDCFIELYTYNTNAIEDSKITQEQQHLLRSGSIDLLELICAKGKLTEKDVEEIRKKIKKVAAKKFLRARVKDASKEDTTQ